MKLVFPGGEHPQVLLGQGVNRVGSDPGANIVLNRPGVMPQHCQLHVTSNGVTLDVPAGATVSVNGTAVSGLIALRRGDTVAFDNVQARLASVDPASLSSQRPGLPPAANDGPAVTAVRSVMPRYVLRAVSGTGFGRNYPLAGSLTVGRAPECGLRLDESGISRLHARLLPTDGGLQIEDLGSTNGTFVNGKRVLHGEAVVGDEIAFDTQRFRLAASATGNSILSDNEDSMRGWRALARNRAMLGTAAAVLVAAVVAVAVI